MTVRYHDHCNSHMRWLPPLGFPVWSSCAHVSTACLRVPCSPGLALTPYARKPAGYCVRWGIGSVGAFTCMRVIDVSTRLEDALHGSKGPKRSVGRYTWPGLGNQMCTVSFNIGCFGIPLVTTIVYSVSLTPKGRLISFSFSVSAKLQSSQSLQRWCLTRRLSWVRFEKVSHHHGKDDSDDAWLWLV